MSNEGWYKKGQIMVANITWKTRILKENEEFMSKQEHT